MGVFFETCKSWKNLSPEDVHYEKLLKEIPEAECKWYEMEIGSMQRNSGY